MSSPAAAPSPTPSTSSAASALSFRASVEDVALVWDSLAHLHAHDVTFDIVTSTLHIDGVAEADHDHVAHTIEALLWPVAGAEPASP